MGFRVEERTGRWWVVNSTVGHDGGLSSTSFYSSSVVMVWELEWGSEKEGGQAGGRAELDGSQGVFVSLKWRNFDRYFGYKHSLCTECQQPAADKLFAHRFSATCGRDGNWWVA